MIVDEWSLNESELVRRDAQSARNAGRKADQPPAAMRAKRVMSEEVAREGARKLK
jgi:hypothetical protein